MTDDLATDIIRRANKCGISINKLCKTAGVSRRWFEYFKKRIPQSVGLYLKIDEKLKEYEQQESTGPEMD